MYSVLSACKFKPSNLLRRSIFGKTPFPEHELKTIQYRGECVRVLNGGTLLRFMIALKNPNRLVHGNTRQQISHDTVRLMRFV